MTDTDALERVKGLERAYRRFRKPPKFARANRTQFYALRLDLGAPPPQPSFDWRVQAALAPPKDQGHCQSCTANALAAAIEDGLRIAHAGETRRVDANFLHTCVSHGGQIADPNKNCVSGADLAPTVTALHAAGYEFVSAASPNPFPAGACATGARAAIAGSRPLAGPNDAKAAILRAPIVSEMYFWQDFLRHGGDVYHPNMTGPMYPHSVCVIGWSQIGWIIKNSMGAGWGSGGFATIPYGACGLFGPPPANGYATDSFTISA